MIESPTISDERTSSVIYSVERLTERCLSLVSRLSAYVTALCYPACAFLSRSSLATFGRAHRKQPVELRASHTCASSRRPRSRTPTASTQRARASPGQSCRRPPRSCAPARASTARASRCGAGSSPPAKPIRVVRSSDGVTSTVEIVDRAPVVE